MSIITNDVMLILRDDFVNTIKAKGSPGNFAKFPGTLDLKCL